MEQEKSAYVLTSYRGNLEGQIGVFLDIDKLNEKRHELFMEEIGNVLQEMGASATAEELVEVAIKDEFGFRYNDGRLYFCYFYHPNGVCCRVNGHEWELNVDILPLLG